MNRLLRISLAAFCLVGALGSISTAAEPQNGSADNAIGRRVPDFVVPDTTNKQIALSDFSEAKILVVVFMGTECPIGNAYVPDLVDLHKRYREQQVQVIGINSNLSDSAESIARHVQEFQVAFPVLVDGGQLAADLLGATRTPEVFVLDHRRRIRYRGRIDDRVGYDFKRNNPQRADLEEAVKELLSGKEVSLANTTVEGCLITRRVNLQDKSKITYAGHVAPILHNRCANCHHPGTAAPFSLLDYEDARDWSEMIREVVVERRMPPWNADPRYGHFSNDLRLQQNEVDTLVAWIDGGAALGDEKDLPTPPQYADGWLIGKPDIVLQMPREYTVQASGTVKYQYFVTPTNFEEDVWVQASEARPGNWSVVHHIIAFIREKGSQQKDNLPIVGGFAPGEEPMIFPEGVGFRIPAGGEIVWQVHYTPTGKVETDCSELGLVVCRKPPQRAVEGGGAFNFTFSIPPGAANHRVVSHARFSDDIELLSLMPHMHLRGKDFRYTARYPDGTTEILLNVPEYDFNWQHRYRFAKPKRIPKGTTIECVAHFDNSADNPANPDPTQTVRWGDQTWEEMMIGWYAHVDALPQDADQRDGDRAEKVQTPQIDIWTAAALGKLDLIEQHLAAGTNINPQEPVGGSTPLIAAAAYGQAEAAKLLIEKGADLQAKNHNGATALHAAAFFAHPKIVELLLAHGATRDAKNNSGKTPLDTVTVTWSSDLEKIYRSLGLVLQTKLDLERIKTVRPEIARLLQR